MQPASIVPSTAPPPLRDPLGTRLIITDRPGERLEQLRFAPELLSAAFEGALREQVARLGQFRHPCYARVRRVDRLEGGTALALVSEHPRGARLSDVLAVAERDGLELDINAALCVVRQLVPAVAALHHASRGAAHGAISPDRILITPHARIVITEHVVGPAVEQLRLSRSKLWRDLRIMAPGSPGDTPRLDGRADIVQIGAVSLALILGRLLRADELETLPELLAAARERTVLGRKDLVAAPLRRWLLRALQLDRRGSFESTADAQAGLDDVLSEEGGYVPAPIALESFLVGYQEHAATPRSPDAAHSPTAPVTVNALSQAAVSIVAPGSVGHLPSTQSIVGATGGAPSVQPHLPPALAPVAVGATSQATEAGSSNADEPVSEAGADTLTANERAELKGFLEDIDGTGMRPAQDLPTAPPQGAIAALAPVSGSYALAEPCVTGPPSRVTRQRLALMLCAAVAIGEAGYIWKSKAARPGPAAEGLVSIESRPAGATVVIDDRERGVTPLSLSLSPGPHVVALRLGTTSRAVPLTVRAGMTHAQYVELAPSVTTGAIDVQVGTPGARITLDGQPRGSAPITIPDVPEGDHELIVETGGGAVRQRVMVQAGLTTSVRPMVGETPSGPAPQGGWVTIAVPFEMQVLEAGRQIGTTATRRLPLAPGRHTLDIVSAPLAFRTSVAVDVIAGKETRVPVQLPRGTVAINAIPWAEVWIDGQKAGETPIGSMALPLGPHEFVFRHPDFPERRHAVSVTAGQQTRVSVEMQP